MIAYPEIQDLAKPLGGDASAMEQMTHVTATYLLTGIHFLVPLVALTCACLMVSRVRYSHVFNQLFRRRRKFQDILSLLAGAALVFIVGWLAVPLIFCIFAFGSPVRAAWSAIGRWRTGGDGRAVPPPALAPIATAPVGRAPALFRNHMTDRNELEMILSNQEGTQA